MAIPTLGLTLGNVNAQVVIVGSALQLKDYEDRKLIQEELHFLLYDFLEQAGYDLSQILYVPCFSEPKTYSVDLTGPVLQRDAKEWLVPLLNAYPRKLIIALGNNPLCALHVIDKPEGVNACRGKRLASPVVRGDIIATAHPYMVLKQPDENDTDFFADLVFGKRVLDGDTVEQVAVQIEMLEKPESIITLLDEATQYPVIAYDTETTELDADMALMVCSGFHNGKIEQGKRLARVWAGYDELRPRYEDYVLKQFAEAFDHFFSRANKDYDLVGHSTNFDDWVTETFLGHPFEGSTRDIMYLKWVLNKFGNHGLKENTARYTGYADYDAEVDRRVKETAKRRGRNLYRSNPENEVDFRVLEWAGVPPKLASLDKNKGQGYKWPDSHVLDKKFAAWATLPFDVLIRYQAYDAVYTWMLDDIFMSFIEKDPRLMMSAELRHIIGRRLLRTVQRGMPLNRETNAQFSTGFEKIIESSKSKIIEEVARLDPTLKEFNPKSQPNLRKVLFGEPVAVPFIDAAALYDKYDPGSVDEKLKNFHDKVYRGMEEVSQLVSAKAYDPQEAAEYLKQAFLTQFGKKLLTDEVLNRAVKFRPVFLNGLYTPDPKAFTKGGVPSVGAQVLKNLFVQKEEPLLQYILMHSKAEKLKGTFVDGLRKRVDEFGILRAEYNVCGTKSGRVSGKKPNPQNFVAYLRGQLEARKGYKLVTWDLSQAEVRVAAALSGDTVLMEALDAEDFHAKTASLCLEIPIEEVTKVQRQQFKTLNFAILYGASKFKIAVMMGTDVETAELRIAQYFERFPKLCEWINEQRTRAATEPYWVETAWGTRMSTRNMLSTDLGVRGHTERLAVNMPVQGSAGELTFWYIDKIMTKWEQLYPAHPIFMVNTTHDSCSFECEEALTERLETLVQETINGYTCPVPPLNTVKFVCDVETTFEWYGKPDMYKALDPDFGSDKQKLPWHLITGEADNVEDQMDLEDVEAMEEHYYATHH